MSAEYYPPAGFYFGVSLGRDRIDNQFQSVSGLSVELEMEEYAEGGENRFKHKLPIRTKYPNLVLKRGLVLDSELVRWCKDAFENFQFELKEITISLYDKSQQPIYTWKMSGCSPVKWTVDDLNSMEGKLLIETIEISYQYYTTNSENNANRN